MGLTSSYALSVPFKLLTILTKPIGCQGQPWFHPAVTRSVCDGVRKIKIPFNVNPSRLEEVGDVVWVLTNDEALLQCITLKKSGRISILLAGPNFVVLPHESNRLVTNEVIDGLLLPSAAVKQVYVMDEPSLASHTYVCCTGVDVDFWHPAKINKDSKNVLVYWKTESEDFCITVENLLKKYDWIPRRIRYGSYNLTGYKQLLNECRFAVFMSKSESQGLALAECWAMDVPTLCWNPWNWEYKGKKMPLPSCPFLNPMIGQEWYTLDELNLLLIDMERRLQWYNPRAWVCDHMSDEAAAYQLLNVINQIINAREMR